ncbi:hypothetical protein EJC49_22880 [Aquibium carbonis]|uniref:Transmembrane protein n=1 Tax=Aquibium carbonis TaxID=2495581 RepID=A0A429YNT3_9HYPH|nr:hypothetical protein [Aquibium carbonis]RST83097.1 hypothetical protein EJC49_22880 [Aquibium carbonis]
MGRILLAASVWGLLGMAALPALLYLAVFLLAQVFDPRCSAQAGDPACASAAFGIALASVMPAFGLFFLAGVIAGSRRLRRQTARDFSAVLDGAGTGSPSSGRDEERD